MYAIGWDYPYHWILSFGYPKVVLLCFVRYEEMFVSSGMEQPPQGYEWNGMQIVEGNVTVPFLETEFDFPIYIIYREYIMLLIFSKALSSCYYTYT